ncbi:MAG: hypothetical protein KDE58_08105, partial [Caldilineaceae bacterium]|nr:hypothetical protein [Caldilineaceae bacterium]
HARDVVAASPHPAIQHIGSLEEVVNHLAGACAAGDLVLVMGAGDSNKIGPALLHALQANQANKVSQ